MAPANRVALCERPSHVELDGRDLPTLDPDQVLVKVSVCGVCGSDVAAWRGTGTVRYPCSPGHEFCGTIERAEPKAKGVRVGDRVVIDPNLGCGQCPYCKTDRSNLCDFLKTRPIKSNGGFSDFVAVSSQMVYPLPGSFPDELVPFIEPLSCALHAVRRAKVTKGSRVLIFGAGALGVLAGLALKAQNCEFALVEPSEDRRRQLDGLFPGSALTPDQVADSESAALIDIAIDCSGSAHAIGQAINVLEKAGRLVLAGVVPPGQMGELLWTEITTKELEVLGSWLNPNTFEDAIRIASHNQDFLRAMTTESFRLDDIAEAFECASSQKVCKVLVRP